MSEVDKTQKDGFGSMLKLGLILAIYAAASCTVLAIVNNFTAPKIAQNQERKIGEAMNAFFTGDSYTFAEVKDFEPASTGTMKIEKVILAKNGNTIAGGAAQVSGPTYDQGTILVGIDVDGTVKGLQFLKLSDSPGFGLKANDSTFKLPNGKTFYGQFEGKNAKDGFVKDVTFDAISGATITSNGVAGLLTEGTDCLLKYFKSHAGGQNE